MCRTCDSSMILHTASLLLCLTGAPILLGGVPIRGRTRRSLLALVLRCPLSILAYLKSETVIMKEGDLLLYHALSLPV